MTAPTYQQMINRVLTAVGEGDNLSTGVLSDTYHLKVAQFVNDFLEEVEGAAPWRVLRTTVSATVLAGTLSIALSGVNERSKVWYEVNARNRKLIPVCFDVTTPTSQTRLEEMDLAEVLRRDQDNSNVTDTGGPTHFAVSKTASGVDLYLYPRQAGAINIEIDMLVPQARLDPTSTTDLATSLKVPALPLQYGVTWWAQVDRGEELGVSGDKGEMRYRTLLSDAVSVEMSEQGYDELVSV